MKCATTEYWTTEKLQQRSVALQSASIFQKNVELKNTNLHTLGCTQKLQKKVQLQSVTLQDATTICHFQREHLETLKEKEEEKEEKEELTTSSRSASNADSKRRRQSGIIIRDSASTFTCKKRKRSLPNKKRMWKKGLGIEWTCCLMS